MNVVRHIQIKASQQGLTEAQRSLEGMAHAQDSVAKGSLSMQQAFERQERRFNSTLRAQQDYEKVARQVNAAVAQNPALQARANVVLAQAAAHFDQVTRGQRAMSAALQAANDNIRMFAMRAGTFGSVLSALGPAGLAAAAGLGAGAFAIHQLASAGLALADRAGKLKDFSETTGFTVIELQALEKAGAQVGVSSESVTKGLERFSVAMDDVKAATGPVYETLLQIDPALAKQIARTNSLTEAWDLFAEAARKADLEQRNSLAKATFGKSGIEQTRLLGATVDAGGLKGLIADLHQVDIITAKQADHWDTLGDKINENMKAAKTNIAATFGDASLSLMEKFSEALLKVSRTMREIADAPPPPTTGWAGLLTGVNLITSPLNTVGGVPSPTTGLPGQRAGNLSRLSLSGVRESVFGIDSVFEGPQEAGSKSDARGAAIRAANDNRRLMAVLGEAATPAEQLKDKMLQLAAATANDATVAGVAGRARVEASYQYEQQIAAARLSLGISSEEEIRIARVAQVRHDAARAGIIDLELLAKAERLAAREAREAFEALEIRRSSLPGLKAMEFEFGNLSKQVDQFATGSLNLLASSLADITSGTVSASEGFKNLGLQVLRSLEEMLIKIAIVQPAAAALQQTLSGLGLGGAGGGYTPAPQSILPSIYHSGGVVGETAGPKKFVNPQMFVNAPRLHSGLMADEFPAILQRGETVIPRGGGMGSPRVSINVVNNGEPVNASVGAQRSDGNGGIALDVILDKVQARNMATPGSESARTLAASGVRPRMTRR